MADFDYTDLLPLGADDTEYRLITAEGVRTVEAAGRTFLEVEPEALRQLTEAAIHDISHFLRPSHLAQLRKILDDPESSGNDRFVALDLLKNASISAGGVLPMCQDTGTAIVMGKRGRHVLTDGRRRREHVSRGVYDAYTRLNLRYSQMAPLTMWEEKNTGTQPPGPDRALRRGPARPPGRVQVALHGQGRRLGQQVVPVPGDQGRAQREADAGLPGGEDPLARHRRLPAVPPGRRRRRHVRGVRAEDGQVRQRPLPRLACPPRARRPGTASATWSWRPRSSS